LIEQSQCNDLKREVENTTGIIPGDRGMVDDSWCWQPLCAQVFCGQQAYITSSFVGFVTDGNTNQELSDKARLETAAESSQVCREFRSAYWRSYPKGYGCYCGDQNAVANPGGTTPPQSPLFIKLGAKGEATAGSERAGQSSSTSSIRAVWKTTSPYCKPNATWEIRGQTRNVGPTAG